MHRKYTELVSKGKLILENCTITYISDSICTVIGYQELFNAKWIWTFYNLSEIEASEVLRKSISMINYMRSKDKPNDIQNDFQNEDFIAIKSALLEGKDTEALIIFLKFVTMNRK